MPRTVIVASLTDLEMAVDVHWITSEQRGFKQTSGSRFELDPGVRRGLGLSLPWYI